MLKLLLIQNSVLEVIDKIIIFDVDCSSFTSLLLSISKQILLNEINTSNQAV